MCLWKAFWWENFLNEEWFLHKENLSTKRFPRINEKCFWKKAKNQKGPFQGTESSKQKYLYTNKCMSYFNDNCCQNVKILHKTDFL